MKNLIAIVLITFSCIVNAKWDMSSVYGKDQPLGYIYHTSSVGTQGNSQTQKVLTSLRFVCSAKTNDVILTIVWSGINLNESVFVRTTIDNRLVNESEWAGDEVLIYKNISDVDDIIRQMKMGKTIKFVWVYKSVSYVTAFQLAGLDLGDFNSKCKTQL